MTTPIDSDLWSIFSLAVFVAAGLTWALAQIVHSVTDNMADRRFDRRHNIWPRW